MNTNRVTYSSSLPDDIDFSTLAVSEEPGEDNPIVTHR